MWNRYRKKLILEKSLGTSIGKIWYWKNVPVSVSKIFGTGKKYWYRYRLTFRRMSKIENDNQYLIDKSIADDVEDKAPCRRKNRGRVKTPGAVNLSDTFGLVLIKIFFVNKIR